MKYVVWNSCCDSDLICCDNRASAEELILSIAEEDDFVECNYAINRFGDADTLEEYIDLLCDQWNWDKENCSNECVVLYLGGFNYYIRTIPSLED